MSKKELVLMYSTTEWPSAQMSVITPVQVIPLISSTCSPMKVDSAMRRDKTVCQVLQLQSFQMTYDSLLFEVSAPLRGTRFIHIQWPLNAQPQTITSKPLQSKTITTFQAGAQRVFRLVESLRASSFIASEFDRQSNALLLMRVQISVILSRVIFPAPCQSNWSAGTTRASINKRKLSFWKHLRLMLSNYYKKHIDHYLFQLFCPFLLFTEALPPSGSVPCPQKSFFVVSRRDSWQVSHQNSFLMFSSNRTKNSFKALGLLGNRGNNTDCGTIRLHLSQLVL